jgi:hypothetical protein
MLQRNEEPDMLYIVLNEPSDNDFPGTTRAAIFIRNSGTEAKTSVYLRCDQNLHATLEEICESLATDVAALMTDAENPYAKAERAVLESLAEKGPLPFAQLSDLLVEVSAERLLAEMAIKQKLLIVEGDKLALTEFGRRILSAVQRGSL